MGNLVNIEDSGSAGGRGRPRNPQVDAAAIEATLALLAEQGYEALTIESVANRAGIGKPAIYRRWHGKEMLVCDALRSLHEGVRTPDTGSTWGDLVVLVHDMVDLTNRTVVGAVMGRLVGAALTNPHLMEIFDEAVLQPHRQSARAAIERGIARGELRPDTDPELLIDQVLGTIHYRLLFQGPQAVTEDLPCRLLNGLFGGVSSTGQPMSMVPGHRAQFAAAMAPPRHAEG